MNERDWRIFREDFNISFKGSNVPNPLRKWEEAPLPKELLNVRAPDGRLTTITTQHYQHRLYNLTLPCHIVIYARHHSSTSRHHHPHQRLQ